MDPNNPLQQLLLRGLGTTSLVSERLRTVTQAWVRSGKLDPSQAPALVEDVLKALRGETRNSSSRPSASWNATRTNSCKTWAWPARRNSMNCGAASTGWSGACASVRELREHPNWTFPTDQTAESV